MSKKAIFCQICDQIRDHDVVYVVDGCPVCRCETCGVGRVDVDNFDPRAYYDDGYFLGRYAHSYMDYQGAQETLSREFSRTLKFIRAAGPEDGKLLEVGCAYGFFLQQARQHYDVYGVEIVAEAAAYCQASGLPTVKHGVLTREDMERIGQIDVGVMLDVIEHIDNVAETFGMIADHLRPGGSFVVTTGDWSSFVARVTGKNWRLMAPPLHLWYFTPDSLAALGRRFGLEVVSCTHPWKIVPLELIVQQAGIILGGKRWSGIPGPLKTVGLPANLWDAMRIVFRRPNAA